MDKKILKFILASSMAIGLSLPVSQASAATKVDEPVDYAHARPPVGGIDWKLSRHQEYWDEGYYVVHNTYKANISGKSATKEEWIFYKDSAKRKKVHYQATTYWKK